MVSKCNNIGKSQPMDKIREKYCSEKIETDSPEVLNGV